MLMPIEQSIGILIVDDHAILRAGLREILNNQATMRVVGEAVSGRPALSGARMHQPDVILFNPVSNRTPGVELVADLIVAAPQAGVIVLAACRDTRTQLMAANLGALGLVHKEESFDVLLDAIRAVFAGSIWLDHSIVAGVLGERAAAQRKSAQPDDRARIAALTKREREVIRLIGEGIKNQRIAQRLMISEATVRHHLTSVYAKLGVEDRYELVVYAYRHGLAELPE